jgi:hypothetical protein
MIAENDRMNACIVLKVVYVGKQGLKEVVA